MIRTWPGQTKDEWIKEPIKLQPMDVDLEPEYTLFTSRIDDILTSGTEEDILRVIDDLYLLRRNSLVVDGEFGKGNLIFKTIRNDGLLDALKEKRVEISSKELSI